MSKRKNLTRKAKRKATKALLKMTPEQRAELIAKLLDNA